MKVAVIGGGVIGLCCAHYLREDGADVILIEKDTCGAACSRGNTGWICPSLSAPLPAPGVMGGALRGMFRPDSPLRIRFPLEPKFLRWSWEFRKASSPERYKHGLETTLAIGLDAPARYAELQNAGVRFDIHSTGMVVAALSRSGLSEYEMMIKGAIDAGYEGAVERLGAAEIRSLEPALSVEVIGGLHVKSESYVRPEELTRGLKEHLLQSGVNILEGTAVQKVARTNGSWKVRTATESFSADHVVVAAGAWSAELLSDLGVGISLEAAKGYSVTATGSGTAPGHALYLAEAKVGTSTFGKSLRIAGIFDLTGIGSPLNPKRIRVVSRSATAYLANWRPQKTELEWAGFRPYPPDGLPIIGPVPGREGLVVATGHGRMGMTLGPATGAAVSKLVTEEVRVPEIRPFRVERFHQR